MWTCASVKIVCSLQVCVGFLLVLRLPPTPQLAAISCLDRWPVQGGFLTLARKLFKGKWSFARRLGKRGAMKPLPDHRSWSQNPGSLVLIHPNSSCDLNAGTSDTDINVQQETEDTLFHPWVVLENPGSSVNFPNGSEGRDGVNLCGGRQGLPFKTLFVVLPEIRLICRSWSLWSHRLDTDQRLRSMSCFCFFTVDNSTTTFFCIYHFIFTLVLHG